MTTYVYACSICDMPKDIEQKIGSEALRGIICEHCQEGELVRTVCAPFLEFKGAGWTEKQKRDWYKKPGGAL
jgi:predicted nucleic acid-binding Zn ribbon protein